MAPRITGSSDREKRKSRSSNRPITQGQNPQRSNRQGVSRATVSTADTRNPDRVRAGLNQTNKPNGGRVTGTQGRPSPTTPAKVTGGTPTPPNKPLTRQSRVNGRLKPGTDARPSPNTRGSAKPAANPAGPARPSIGNVSGPASNPNRPAGPTGPTRPSIGNVRGPASSPNRPGTTAKPTGNFRAPSLPKGSAKVAANVGRNVGRGLLAKAVVLPDIALTANSVFNPNSEGNQQLAKAMAAVNQRYAGKNGPRFKNPNTGSVASKGSSPKASFNEKAYASQQKFDVPKPKAKPQAPARTSSGSGSSNYSGSSASRPSVRAAAASKPEMKQTGDKEKDMQTWRNTAGKQKGYGGKTLAQNLDDRNARIASNSAPNYTQKTTGTYKAQDVSFSAPKFEETATAYKGSADTKKTEVSKPSVAEKAKDQTDTASNKKEEDKKKPNRALSIGKKVLRGIFSS